MAIRGSLVPIAAILIGGGCGDDTVSLPDLAGTSDAALRDLAAPSDGAPAPDLASPLDASTDGAVSTAQPLGPKGSFNLIFADEFDDSPMMSGPKNGLQPTKWNSGWYTTGITATSPPVQSTEAEWYGPEGIQFPGDGAVHLHLFKNPSTQYNKQYESGCITTAQHFTFSAGAARTVLEARIRVAGPDAQAGGYWPAYWLLSHLDGPAGNGTWPPEIDLFEFFGGTTNPVAHLHTTGGDINKGFPDSSGATDLSLDYHVYTVDLSSTAIVFYLDGAEQWRETDSTIIARLLDFDPMYVLLNFQFGGAAGSPTGTVPNDMVIDYFRAWQ